MAGQCEHTTNEDRKSHQHADQHTPITYMFLTHNFHLTTTRILQDNTVYVYRTAGKNLLHKAFKLSVSLNSTVDTLYFLEVLNKILNYSLLYCDTILLSHVSTLSFVPINLHGCQTRECTHSILHCSF